MGKRKSFLLILCKYNISTSTTEEYHHHHNPDEFRIHFYNKGANTIFDWNSAPILFWLYDVFIRVRRYNYMAKSSHMVRSSHLYSFGITPYISQFIYYTLWDPVYYYNVGEKLLIPKEQRFFWIGPMRHCSDARIQTSVVPSQL